MSTEIVQYTVPDIERMAISIAASKLFGVQSKEQAMALMLIAQAEGRHPALAARDYNIIQNKPAKTSDAMLRDFLASGGKVQWHKLDDTQADATFSHPAGGSVRIDWDMERAKTAGLGGKDMWKKYPRQMLRARVISEGVRTVCPEATSGMYVPEEVKDFDDKPMKDVTPVPEPTVDPVIEEIEALKIQARDAALSGGESLDAFLKALPKEKKKHLVHFGKEIRAIATEVDNKSMEGSTIDGDAP